MTVLTPYLTVADAHAAIRFYADAFGATETRRFADGNRIGFAELAIGEAIFFLSDAYPEIGVHAPEHYGGSPVALSLSVADVDAVVASAVSAGAEILRAVADQVGVGIRNGIIRDPFGYRWFVNAPL